MLFLSMLLFATSIVALVSCLIFLFKKQKKKGLIAIAICVISIFVGNFFMEINDKNDEPLYSVELKKTDTNYDSSQRMWTLTADKNGKYTLKLKANKDGKITVTSKSDPNTNFKVRVYNVKANEVVKVPLTVKTGSNNSAADFYIKADDMRTVEVFLSNPNYVEKSQSSSSEVSSQESLANLKATISSPMNMQNYLNIENNVINAAKSYNDIIDGNDDVSAEQSRNVAQRNYKTQMNNLNDLIKKAGKDYKSQKSHLTVSDWKLLQNYQNSLVDYLNELSSYASEIQNATPVLNDPSTPDDTKKDEQTDLNNAQNKFNQAKQHWQNQYNFIMNRN